MTEKELQAFEKQPVDSESESTRSGPIFVPAVDIFESEKGMTVLADMPGVKKEGLTIDLKDNTLTIRGELPAEEETGSRVVYREYEEGDYFRQFALSEVIDQRNISATLKNGVLTLFLPKIEPAQPRKIEVKVG
jgi:HSP20 family protein